MKSAVQQFERVNGGEKYIPLRRAYNIVVKLSGGEDTPRSCQQCSALLRTKSFPEELWPTLSKEEARKKAKEAANHIDLIHFSDSDWLRIENIFNMYSFWRRKQDPYFLNEASISLRTGPLRPGQQQKPLTKKEWNRIKRIFRMYKKWRESTQKCSSCRYIAAASDALHSKWSDGREKLIDVAGRELVYSRENKMPSMHRETSSTEPMSDRTDTPHSSGRMSPEQMEYVLSMFDTVQLNDEVETPLNLNTNRAWAEKL